MRSAVAVPAERHLQRVEPQCLRDVLYTGRQTERDREKPQYRESREKRKV